MLLGNGRSNPVCFILLCAISLPMGCGGDGPSPNMSREIRETSHQTMIAVLRDVAERTSAENPYLGDANTAMLRRQLRSLAPAADLQTLWSLHSTLGEQELILGNTEVAIQHFREIEALTEKYREHLTAEQHQAAPYWLGVAFLRLGENENCCQRNTPESCILPIQGAGIHTQQRGSREAIRQFTKLLESSVRDSQRYTEARWLLNIAYMTIGGYPEDVPSEYLIPPDVFESDEPFPRFENIAPRLGLNAFDLCGGVVIDDFDNDGYLDILTSTWHPEGQMRLFRNQRNGDFEDVTAATGLDGIRGGLNMVQADYNNDGHVDVFVLRGAWLDSAGRHPNSLLRNNGNLSFTDVTFAAGLGDQAYPTQTAAWGDFDNDGDLDLYVGNESTDSMPAANQLFRNNGDETFTDIAAEAGVEDHRMTKAVVWGDYDNDGRADLYVSNLFGENRLYRNEGDQKFRDVAPALGVQHPSTSFPAWFWDFNNDGAIDIFVASYNSSVGKAACSYLGLPFDGELHCLYQGDGKGGFREVAAEMNLTRLSDPMGSNFGDLDGDGYLDFYLGTGYPYYEALTPNVMYRNRGGHGFADISSNGGFGHLQKGHGVAFADLDHDGDQDVFEQMGGAYLGDKFANTLYENPGFENHWLKIKLVGVTSNRSAIGAKIRIDVVENGNARSIHRTINSGGSFGCNPLMRTIGLGHADEIRELEIYWPASQTDQRFNAVPMDQMIEIEEHAKQWKARAVQPFQFKG